MIRVENLAKSYRLGAHQDSYATLRETVTNQISSQFQRLTPEGRSKRRSEGSEEFWALRDISLHIEKGDIAGFIGRNGAGKSTLLKILSRITEPTVGRVTLHGRVASLLEVGTGFHRELTGRENIYLNGAILGMPRREINSKFDEIVAFSEVERFIDTPVKRYSSGMYVRLAFAVAAHLEPEILIVDEVLAVGDAAFQRKCLGKIGDVASQDGRTVLFVSHNMAAIRSLCTEVHTLEGGRLVDSGDPDRVVDDYLQSMQAEDSDNSTSLADRSDRAGDGSAMMTAIKIEEADGAPLIKERSRLRVTIDYAADCEIRHPQFSATIYDHERNIGLISLHSEVAGGLPDLLPKKGRVVCLTEPLGLTPGRCHVNLTLLKGGTRADYVQRAAIFDVEESDVFGTGKTPDRGWALCLRHHDWFVSD